MKSCRGEQLESAQVEPWGLLGDRRWMLIDPIGEVVTAREVNPLVLVTPRLTEQGLRLSAPGMPELEVARPLTAPLVGVEIWDDRLVAREADQDAAAWLTEVSGRSLRLVYSTTRVGGRSMPVMPSPAMSSPSPTAIRCCWPPRNPWPS